jgi:hypothetical protein
LGFITAPDDVFQCFLNDCRRHAQPELRIPRGARPKAPVWNPQFRRAGRESQFYQHNQVVDFLARRLLVWLVGCPLSLFINRGAFLNLSLQADGTITIHGILVPVSWNTSGEIMCVAVSTFDEKEYRIADDDATRQWQEYLNREISIQGQPFSNGVEQWITVHSFHVDQSAQDAGPNDI